MPAIPSPYFSFLLRLWLAGDNDQPEWRLTLTDPQTDQTCGFASLETLMAFLRVRMEAAQNPQAGEQTATPTSCSEEDIPIP